MLGLYKMASRKTFIILVRFLIAFEDGLAEETERHEECLVAPDEQVNDSDSNSWIATTFKMRTISEFRIANQMLS